MDKDSSNVTVGTSFLARDARFRHEKPYSMRYSPEIDILQSNLIQDAKSVQLEDMRHHIGTLEFEKCGFQVMSLESSMAYSDFEDEGKVTRIYREEIASTLGEKLQATHVHVLDHVIRRRHASFPISTGKDWDHEQPTNLVHMDFSRREAERTIEKHYGHDEAGRIMQYPWRLVNTWRPLHGPLVDWPLALCDASTVDFSNDTTPADIVYPHWVTENLQVYYNRGQKWYYLSKQLPSEVIVFTSMQSNPDKPDGCPHAGAFNPLVGPKDRLRESIESRVLVFHAPLRPFPPKIGKSRHI